MALEKCSTIEGLFSILKTIAPSYNFRKIVVFGSIARGDYTEESDIDLVVAFNENKKDVLSMCDFAGTLEELCGKPVQVLIDIELRNKQLIQNIVEDGIEVYPLLRKFEIGNKEGICEKNE